MAYFPGPHLKITTPQTFDGMNLAHDSSGNVITKVTFLPLSAKKAFEKKNLKLPQHLRHKIEEMGGYQPAPAKKVTKSNKA